MPMLWRKPCHAAISPRHDHDVREIDVKTILVAGGAGYVGSHCCKAFARAGYKVVVFDNLYRGWRDLVQWGDLIEGDILDPAALDRAMAEVKPDVVAHFAALTYVGESVSDPGRYYANNSLGAFNILEAMRAHEVKTFIFSSMSSPSTALLPAVSAKKEPTCRPRSDKFSTLGNCEWVRKSPNAMLTQDTAERAAV